MMWQIISRSKETGNDVLYQVARSFLRSLWKRKRDSLALNSTIRQSHKGVACTPNYCH